MCWYISRIFQEPILSKISQNWRNGNSLCETLLQRMVRSWFNTFRRIILEPLVRFHCNFAHWLWLSVVSACARILRVGTRIWKLNQKKCAKKRWKYEKLAKIIIFCEISWRPEKIVAQSITTDDESLCVKLSAKSDSYSRSFCVKCEVFFCGIQSSFSSSIFFFS